ncbi:hypothetical protein IWQ60_005574 [Tieghemiomyces parasiticus]|uniref:Uncharacterized protein n=1 Tax=Tieghemiomyces parasiticus TaxID=78921 RepID=A0A9W8ABJ0_9FUNG|nr:hypothetical protein IWQ60_005574 [Tieghemiomyces parasiticus]
MLARCNVALLLVSAVLIGQALSRASAGVVNNRRRGMSAHLISRASSPEAPANMHRQYRRGGGEDDGAGGSAEEDPEANEEVNEEMDESGSEESGGVGGSGGMYAPFESADDFISWLQGILPSDG